VMAKKTNGKKKIKKEKKHTKVNVKGECVGVTKKKVSAGESDGAWGGKGANFWTLNMPMVKVLERAVRNVPKRGGNGKLTAVGEKSAPTLKQGTGRFLPCNTRGGSRERKNGST